MPERRPAGNPSEVGVPEAVQVSSVARGRTVAVAESLTGGAVLDALVTVPGASAYLRGGVVAYATDVKVGLLGVPAGLVAREGAVDPGVALAMAEGVRRVLAADVGVATTGVAGPEPQDGRAAGEFHVAVVGPGTRRAVRTTRVAAVGRQAVRGAATAEAVAALREALAADGAPPESGAAGVGPR